MRQIEATFIEFADTKVDGSAVEVFELFFGETAAVLPELIAKLGKIGMAVGFGEEAIAVVIQRNGGYAQVRAVFQHIYPGLEQAKLVVGLVYGAVRQLGAGVAHLLRQVQHIHRVTDFLEVEAVGALVGRLKLAELDL